MASDEVTQAGGANGKVLQHKQRRPIRRYRESLTCTACRLRKLKCDKKQPCGSCVRRNDGDSCSYQKGPERAAAAETELQNDAEEKLEHLEQLLRQLIRTQDPNRAGGLRQISEKFAPGQISNSSDSDEDNETGGPVYIGSTHWSAMLDEIKELKAVIRSGAEDEEYLGEPTAPPARDFDILFGRPEFASLEEVLSEYLPSRAEVDQSVDAYFNAKSATGSFLHEPQFRRLYAEFWQQPGKAPALWVSILFSICHLSKKVGFLIETDPERLVAAEYAKERCLVAAAQCLAIGRYYQPKRWCLEAICLYVQCKCTNALDPSRDLGVMLGTMIQVAHLMGYHRDPDHLRNLSPFEKEMRRRVWALCMQLELLLSFQLGIPSNIQAFSWDTRLPRNLLDSDFDENTIEFPPDRPDSEPTRICFFISKQKLMIAFERIFRHALASNYSSEAELTVLDRDIRETYQGVPEIMRVRKSADQLDDQCFLIATRHCVEYIYQKCLCVLHRKYVLRGREKSIAICIDSASRMAEEFLEMYQHFKPGGLMYSNRWMFSSIMWNDFLVAVNVLCLVLTSQNRNPNSGIEKHQARIEDLLKQAYRVCTETSVASRGAQRVCHLLYAVLAPRGVRFGIEDLALSTGEGVRLASQLPEKPAVMQAPGTYQEVSGQLYLPEAERASLDFDSFTDMNWDDSFIQAVLDPHWQYPGQHMNSSGYDIFV